MPQEKAQMSIARIFAAVGMLGLMGGCARHLGPGTEVIPIGLAAAPITADPENCDPIRRASIDITFRGLAFVTAAINGRPVVLVLDTGAEQTVLTAAVAKRLNITPRYEYARPMRGIGAVIATGDAKVESFAIGGYALPYPRVLVGDVVLPDFEGIAPDGLLGADLLADFDLDLDLPHRRLTLYQRLVCSSLRPPWTGPYTEIETTRSLHRHPFFPVLLDGHPLTGFIDSGSQRTVLATQSAAQAGVTMAALSQDPVQLTRGVGAETLRSYAHRFQQMVVGAETIRNFILLVADIALPRAEADLVLGIDFLQSRRIWLSYGSRRLFVAHPG